MALVKELPACSADSFDRTGLSDEPFSGSGSRSRGANVPFEYRADPFDADKQVQPSTLGFVLNRDTKHLLDLADKSDFKGLAAKLNSYSEDQILSLSKNWNSYKNAHVDLMASPYDLKAQLLRNAGDPQKKIAVMKRFDQAETFEKDREIKHLREQLADLKKSQEAATKPAVTQAVKDPAKAELATVVKVVPAKPTIVAPAAVSPTVPPIATPTLTDKQQALYNYMRDNHSSGFLSSMQMNTESKADKLRASKSDIRTAAVQLANDIKEGKVLTNLSDKEKVHRINTLKEKFNYHPGDNSDFDKPVKAIQDAKAQEVARQEAERRLAAEALRNKQIEARNQELSKAEVKVRNIILDRDTTPESKANLITQVMEESNISKKQMQTIVGNQLEANAEFLVKESSKAQLQDYQKLIKLLNSGGYTGTDPFAKWEGKYEHFHNNVFGKRIAEIECAEAAVARQAEAQRRVELARAQEQEKLRVLALKAEVGAILVDTNGNNPQKIERLQQIQKDLDLGGQGMRELIKEQLQQRGLGGNWASDSIDKRGQAFIDNLNENQVLNLLKSHNDFVPHFEGLVGLGETIGIRKALSEKAKSFEDERARIKAEAEQQEKFAQAEAQRKIQEQNKVDTRDLRIRARDFTSRLVLDGNWEGPPEKRQALLNQQAALRLSKQGMRREFGAEAEKRVGQIMIDSNSNTEEKLRELKMLKEVFGYDAQGMRDLIGRSLKAQGLGGDWTSDAIEPGGQKFINQLTKKQVHNLIDSHDEIRKEFESAFGLGETKGIRAALIRRAEHLNKEQTYGDLLLTGRFDEATRYANRVKLSKEDRASVTAQVERYLADQSRLRN